MSAAAPGAVAPGVLNNLWKGLTSSLGAKLVMAITGLGFYAWLCFHMIGNLEIFHAARPDGTFFFNDYAHFLHSAEFAPALWASRAFLVVVVGLHVLSGVRLWWLNRKARPVGYRARSWRQASLASRTMIVTGALAALFIVGHLAHFTWDWFGEAPAGMDGRPDVYLMVVEGFHDPLVAGAYIAAMLVIGFHLWHAVWSALQTLGLNGPTWTPFAKRLGFVLGAVLALGFTLVPLVVLLGGFEG